MEEFKRGLFRVLGILAIFITIAWYGDLDHIRKDKTTHDNEYDISYQTARNTLEHPIYSTNTYHYQNVTVVTYTRTLIPFKYTKGTTTNTRQYYSRGGD